ncbi:DUF1566 domain-containing protein [Paucibacter sp. Y2R2-4]|uniref:Lcl C-terminal domain-containing protein n=1 Tax=Paucibacter sp. Y2R2-4 TaxID=2893553 RepID=UPI0021E4B2A4|nr:DUF1566 domain-containing protein [Paucibacter sp. Y2R2-4]MCV2351557.1 DUF1566 domain-containing protein [Paucibacter sp. Y2R2-4]
MFKSSTLVLVCAAFTCLQAGASQQCEGPPKRNAADFVAIGDGSQVYDKTTHLIWMRCVEDQSWNGSTCIANDPDAVNPGPRLSYQQAKALAATLSTSEERWRLPTRKELLTLREPNCYNPSQNLTVFPTKPAWSSDGAFWTSSPEAKGVSLVSAIGTSDAWAATDEGNTNHVRLVRTPSNSSKK